MARATTVVYFLQAMVVDQLGAHWPLHPSGGIKVLQRFENEKTIVFTANTHRTQLSHTHHTPHTAISHTPHIAHATKPATRFTKHATIKMLLLIRKKSEERSSKNLQKKATREKG
jgi:hypothetical protein